MNLPAALAAAAYNFFCHIDDPAQIDGQFSWRRIWRQAICPAVSLPTSTLPMCLSALRDVDAVSHPSSPMRPKDCHGSFRYDDRCARKSSCVHSRKSHLFHPRLAVLLHGPRDPRGSRQDAQVCPAQPRGAWWRAPVPAPPVGDEIQKVAVTHKTYHLLTAIATWAINHTCIHKGE